MCNALLGNRRFRGSFLESRWSQVVALVVTESLATPRQTLQHRTMKLGAVSSANVVGALALWGVLCCGRTGLDAHDGSGTGESSANAPGGTRSSAGPGETGKGTGGAAGGGGGTGFLQGTSPRVLADGLGCPSHIAVDASHVYWTDSVRGNVMKVGLTGGAATTLVEAQQEPRGIAVDSGHVYWVDSAAGKVLRVPLSGGGVDTLATGQSRPQDLVVGTSSLYWVNNGKISLGPGMDGGVMKVDLPSGKPTSLATSEAWPTAIAMDGTNLYWTNAGTQDGDYTSGEVRKMPLNGSGRPVTIATIGSMSNSRLAVHDTSVYWITAGYVLETGIGGDTRINVIASVNGWNPGGGTTTAVALAVDATGIYWSESGTWICRTRLPGYGPCGLIALQHDGGDGSIALDSTSVYWSNCGEGTIMGRAK